MVLLPHSRPDLPRSPAQVFDLFKSFVARHRPKLDIEQAAALKKLESEANFANQQDRIEQSAALEKQEAEITKLEAEAQSKRKKADTMKMLEAAEEPGEKMMEWLGQHRLQHCAADIRRIAGACAATSLQCAVESLSHWWRSACRTVLPSDLQYLTDENVAEIGMRCRFLHLSSASYNALLCGAGKAMTHIEKMRLQAAMQALRGATPSRLLSWQRLT